MQEKCKKSASCMQESLRFLARITQIPCMKRARILHSTCKILHAEFSYLAGINLARYWNPCKYLAFNLARNLQGLAGNVQGKDHFQCKFLALNKILQVSCKFSASLLQAYCQSCLHNTCKILASLARWFALGPTQKMWPGCYWQTPLERPFVYWENMWLKFR